MAQARAIKSRIKSAKNIAQITKAMEMVSAAKMKKAQDRVRQSEPYATKLRQILRTLAGLVKNAQHPLLNKNASPKNALIVVISSDKGLSGALNSNVYRETGTLLRQLTLQGVETEFIAIGKRSSQFLRYTRRKIAAVFDGLGDKVQYGMITPIVHLIIEGFIEKKYDAIYVIYPRFVSTLVQKTERIQLLPISLEESDKKAHNTAGQVPVFEPSSEAILNWLLPYYVEQQMYQFVLQSSASEHSARMIAMKNATDNAKDVRKSLELEYNSARQAQITQQIAEIASATMV
ncbi:MAG: ATP synthase F1 subunit gamma [bacterium]|nr:ATP synthase F1 subunit gamma [bacterium]